MDLLRIALRCRLLPLYLVLAAGCSSTVQEDRSINYSEDGGGVAFQHGEDGVFVASADGESLQKVYQASEETIAVSAPLWSPTDKRLIFTTARPANTEGRMAELADWGATPEGRQYAPEETIYTCFLRAASDDSDAPAPVALFEASCEHPGYVAANVAVRWRPAGDRILYVDCIESGRHSLFEFDLETKERRRVLPFSATDLIFDWTPNGSYLVCVLANDERDPKRDGIWILPVEDDSADEEAADETRWWRVPNSQHLSLARSSALLEQLRATRPVWTRDEERFAFVASYESSAADSETARHVIMTASPTSREAKLLVECAAPVHDLHWEPERERLGFIEDADPIVLRIVNAAGEDSSAAHELPARRFAGWNYDGSKLAYVVPESPPTGRHWAWLFPRVPDARDHVYVADGNGKDAGKAAHAGVRITFPQWSPTKNSLSLWGTYTPTHRSLLSNFLPWSLRPGDPAAILDCQSGQMSWLAVNSHERAQVGHYHLMRREYEEAWRWYELAAADREAPLPIKLSQLDRFLRQLRIHNDPTFFEYICLTKLGREDEASERLKQFRIGMSFEPDLEAMEEIGEQWEGNEEQVRAELELFLTFATPLIQDAYITEVFLSLDAATDGITFFRRQLETATTRSERLAALLCLSQLQLVQDDRQAYAELAATKLAPLLMDLIDSPKIAADVDITDLPKLRRTVEDFTVLSAGRVALGPLSSQEFLAPFSDEQLRGHVDSWKQLGARADNDAERLGVDSVLAGLLKRLQDSELAEVESRLDSNPLKGMFEFEP